MSSLVPLIPKKKILVESLEPPTHRMSYLKLEQAFTWCLGNLFPLEGARFLLPFITLHASEISNVSWFPPLLTFSSIFILLKISIGVH
jgi:hypothetical protein